MKQSDYHSLSLNQKLSVLEKYFPRAQRDSKRYETLKAKSPGLAEFYRRANNVLGRPAWRTPEDYKLVQAARHLKDVQSGKAKPVATPLDVLQDVSDKLRTEMTNALGEHIDLEDDLPSDDPTAFSQLWEGVAFSATKEERQAVAFFWQKDSILRSFQNAAAAGQPTQDVLDGMNAKLDHLDESFLALRVCTGQTAATSGNRFAASKKVLQTLYKKYEALFALSHGKPANEEAAILNSAQELDAQKNVYALGMKTLSKEGKEKTAKEEQDYTEAVEEGFTPYEEADPEIVPLFKSFTRMFSRKKDKVNAPEEKKPAQPFLAKAGEKLARTRVLFSSLGNAFKSARQGAHYKMPRLPRGIRYAGIAAGFAGLFWVGAKFAGTDFGNLKLSNKTGTNSYLPMHLGARGPDAENENDTTLVAESDADTAATKSSTKILKSDQVDAEKEQYGSNDVTSGPVVEGQKTRKSAGIVINNLELENAGLRCMISKKQTGNKKILTTPYEINMARTEAISLLDSINVHHSDNEKLAALYKEVDGILALHIKRMNDQKMIAIEREVQNALMNSMKAQRNLFELNQAPEKNTLVPLGLMGDYYSDFKDVLANKYGRNSTVALKFYDYLTEIRGSETRLQNNTDLQQTVREMDIIAKKLGVGDFSRMALRGHYRNQADKASHSFNDNSNDALGVPRDERVTPRYVSTKTVAPVFALRM